MAVEDPQHWDRITTEETVVREEIADPEIEIERVKIEWDKNKVVKEVDSAPECLEQSKNAAACIVEHEVVSPQTKYKILEKRTLMLIMFSYLHISYHFISYIVFGSKCE